MHKRFPDYAIILNFYKNLRRFLGGVGRVYVCCFVTERRRERGSVKSILFRLYTSIRTRVYRYFIYLKFPLKNNYNSINKSLIASKFYSTKEIELPYNSIFDENDKSILLLNPCGSGYIYLNRMNDEPHPVVKITNVINKNINFNNDCIDLEKAGSASININTGNLIYQYYDSKYLADYSLFNVQHIYSGNFVNESFTPYGKGFKSIYNEIIYKEGINYIY